MVQHSFWVGFTIVWVYLKSTVHTCSESLLSGNASLSGGVRSRVSNNGELISKLVASMLNKGKMLFPIHEMTLSCSSSHYDSLASVGNLEIYQVIISIQINSSCAGIWSFDGCDHSRAIDFLHIFVQGGINTLSSIHSAKVFVLEVILCLWHISFDRERGRSLQWRNSKCFLLRSSPTELTKETAILYLWSLGNATC
mgnify:CR=1 FL=1